MVFIILSLIVIYLTFRRKIRSAIALQKLLYLTESMVSACSILKYPVQVYLHFKEIYTTKIIYDKTTGFNAELIEKKIIRNLFETRKSYFENAITFMLILLIFGLEGQAAVFIGALIRAV